MPLEIRTLRLCLLAQTTELARAELEKPHALFELLNAVVPADWPPPLNDRDSMEWSLRKLEGNPCAIGWLLWYMLLPIGGQSHAVGVAGFTGPPVDGRCEIGYSVMPAYQRKGYATEAVQALVQHAFVSPGVTDVIAHTFPDLIPSLGVMAKCGFVFDGPGTEEGSVRYRVGRAVAASFPHAATR